jgi:hypothetical protein
LLLWSIRGRRREQTWWTLPNETALKSAKTASYKRLIVVMVTVLLGSGVALGELLPHRTPQRSNSYADGSVLWKATSYRLDNGSGIIFDGSGRRIQIYLGENADLADLAVDSGYLTSSGHIAFLPPGKAPTYQGCLGALRSASSSVEPLTVIIPGQHAGLCSSSSNKYGGIAYFHVTRNDQSSLTMNITVWNYTL